jgi:hypothetical protein
MKIDEIFKINKIFQKNKNIKIRVSSDIIKINYFSNNDEENFPELNINFDCFIKLIIGFSINMDYINIKTKNRIFYIDKTTIIDLNLDKDDIITLLPEKNKPYEIYIKLENISLNTISLESFAYNNLESESEFKSECESISESISEFKSESKCETISESISEFKSESKSESILQYSDYYIKKPNKFTKIIIILTKIIKSIGEYFKIFFNRNGIECEIIYKISILECLNSIYNKDIIYLILFNNETHNLLPNRYIFYQIEQIGSIFLTDKKFLKRLKYMCKKAEQVWEYSNISTNIYKKYCLNTIKLVPLPFIYDKLEQQNIVDFDSLEYDIFFYGHKNERRDKILLELKKHFKIKIGYGYYAEKKVKYILKSKIIINLHFYKEAGLETCRINEILNFNKIIISENSPLDKYNIELYNDIIVLVDIIEDDLSNIKLLINKVKYYLNKHNYLEKIKVNILKIQNLEKQIINTITNTIINV